MSDSVPLQVVEQPDAGVVSSLLSLYEPLTLEQMEPRSANETDPDRLIPVVPLIDTAPAEPHEMESRPHIEDDLEGLLSVFRALQTPPTDMEVDSTDARLSPEIEYNNMGQ